MSAEELFEELHDEYEDDDLQDEDEELVDDMLDQTKIAPASRAKQSLSSQRLWC